MFLFNSYHYTLYTSLLLVGGAGWHPGGPENHIPMIHLPLTRNSLYLLSDFRIFIFLASTVFCSILCPDAQHTTHFVPFLWKEHDLRVELGAWHFRIWIGRFWIFSRPVVRLHHPLVIGRRIGNGRQGWTGRVILAFRRQVASGVWVMIIFQSGSISQL
jgi:hypothetical protein